MKHDPSAAEVRAVLPVDLIDELGLARLAAQRAGAFIADRWLSDVAIHYKGPIDPVSEADLAKRTLSPEDGL